jgi:hypothetical protein
MIPSRLTNASYSNQLAIALQVWRIAFYMQNHGNGPSNQPIAIPIPSPISLPLGRACTISALSKHEAVTWSWTPFASARPNLTPLRSYTLQASPYLPGHPRQRYQILVETEQRQEVRLPHPLNLHRLASRSRYVQTTYREVLLSKQARKIIPMTGSLILKSYCNVMHRRLPPSA